MLKFYSENGEIKTPAQLTPEIATAEVDVEAANNSVSIAGAAVQAAKNANLNSFNVKGQAAKKKAKQTAINNAIKALDKAETDANSKVSTLSKLTVQKEANFNGSDFNGFVFGKVKLTKITFDATNAQNKRIVLPVDIKDVKIDDNGIVTLTSATATAENPNAEFQKIEDSKFQSVLTAVGGKATLIQPQKDNKKSPVVVTMFGVKNDGSNGYTTHVLKTKEDFLKLIKLNPFKYAQDLIPIMVNSGLVTREDFKIIKDKKGKASFEGELIKALNEGAKLAFSSTESVQFKACAAELEAKLKFKSTTSEAAKRNAYANYIKTIRNQNDRNKNMVDGICKEFGVENASFLTTEQFALVATAVSMQEKQAMIYDLTEKSIGVKEEQIKQENYQTKLKGGINLSSYAEKDLQERYSDSNSSKKPKPNWFQDKWNKVTTFVKSLFTGKKDNNAGMKL